MLSENKFHNLCFMLLESGIHNSQYLVDSSIPLFDLSFLCLQWHIHLLLEAVAIKIY